ncbi:ABC transporter ATP-binding protein [Paracoccus caeni]|uniref:ABC transporter ATP-binding protein n=1 Tax=Paracoccus caeni TaxID=657651 RepID=A0A934SA10_9RHOB|nr:ABC transporter ATP-binding protein [Paracoccus caeni]
MIIRDLSCGYPRARVIEGLSLPPLPPGSITTILGPNAAGKTSLLKAIAGQIETEGRIMLGDEDLTRLTAAARSGRVGYMPQTAIGRIGLTVLDCVMTALARTGDAPLDQRAMQVLDRFGVADLANRPMRVLSGGQRQAVSLAVAVARNPVILLLDEPTSALDLARRHLILGHIRALADEGHIVLLVLHDLAFAAQWSDRIAVLGRGRLEAFGTPEDVLTPEILRRVWRIDARVERCSRGSLQIITDGAML